MSFNLRKAFVVARIMWTVVAFRKTEYSGILKIVEIFEKSLKLASIVKHHSLTLAAPATYPLRPGWTIFYNPYHSTIQCFRLSIFIILINNYTIPYFGERAMFDLFYWLWLTAIEDKRKAYNMQLVLVLKRVDRHGGIRSRLM